MEPRAAWHIPSSERTRELAAIQERLEAAGIELGPHGYDEVTLRRAIEEQDVCACVEVAGEGFNAVIERWEAELADAPGVESVRRTCPSARCAAQDRPGWGSIHDRHSCCPAGRAGRTRSCRV